MGHLDRVASRAAFISRVKSIWFRTATIRCWDYHGRVGFVANVHSGVDDERISRENTTLRKLGGVHLVGISHVTRPRGHERPGTKHTS